VFLPPTAVPGAAGAVVPGDEADGG
jgi:hypothetical protein